jgi:hypothetical protein
MGLMTGTALFRVNPKGEPGIWACAAHVKPEQLDPETQQVVAMIESANQTKH